MKIFAILATVVGVCVAFAAAFPQAECCSKIHIPKLPGNVGGNLGPACNPKC